MKQLDSGPCKLVRHGLLVALFLMLLTPTPAEAGPRISLRADAGGMLSSKIQGLDNTASWGLDLRLLWRVSPRLSLGLRQALGFAMVTYSDDRDGTPSLGSCAGLLDHRCRELGDSLTVFPATTFTAHLDLLDGRLGLDLDAGVGLIVAEPLGSFSVFPYPMLATSAEVVLLRTTSTELAIHAGVGLLLLPVADGESGCPLMVFPRAGVTIRF